MSFRGTVKRSLLRRAYRLRPDASLTAHQRFLRDGHNELLFAGQALDTSSVVVEVGGYLGDYADEIVTRYGCTVHVFEPVPQFAHALRSRFRESSSVRVHECGIGLSESTTELRLSADATGAWTTGDEITVRLRAWADLRQEIGPTIDLMAVNIEGGEYQLIEDLHRAHALPQIARLYIQFHRLHEASEQQMQRRRRLISESHDLTWSYDFVWERWDVRGRPDSVGTAESPD
ncbi:MAG: FkbM family methyltransferase [Candidatus Nanopelagicales bacterium]